MANLISCRFGSYGKFPDAAWTHLPSIGITHVEAPIPEPAAVADLKKRLADHGLSAATLQGTLDIQQPNAPEQLAPQLDAAHQLACPIIFLSVKREALPAQTAYDHLRAAGDAAAKAGVTLVLETHPDMITNADVALATMQGTSHPNVRVNFDTANVYYYNENIDAVDQFRKVLDDVAAVHLKETNGQYKGWFFPALGEGIVDFKQIFDLANARNFYGPFTLEIEGIEGESLDEQQTKDRVAKSIDHLRSLGLEIE